MVPVADVASHEPEDLDDSSNEDSSTWEDAQLVMSAIEIPYHQAITGPEKAEWHDAIYAEIRSLIINDTFDIVPRPKDAKDIKCRTVLRNKYNASRYLDRRKARVVAKGYTQHYGVDFLETFAPVARFDSFRLLMALAAKFSLSVSQLDVGTAYREGD